jgi:hypothetical protein
LATKLLGLMSSTPSGATVEADIEVDVEVEVEVTNVRPAAWPLEPREGEAEGDGDAERGCSVCGVRVCTSTQDQQKGEAP